MQFIRKSITCGIVALACGVGCGTEAIPPEAAFPEAMAALNRRAAVDAASAQQAAPVKPPTPVVAKPAESKDVVTVVVGDTVESTYRLTYQVLDGNDWQPAATVPDPFKELSPTKLMRRNDGSTFLMVDLIDVGEGSGINAAVGRLTFGLGQISQLKVQPDGKQASFTFSYIDGKGAEHLGTAIVADKGVFRRFAVIIGMVGASKASTAGMDAKMAAELAFATLNVI